MPDGACTALTMKDGLPVLGLHEAIRALDEGELSGPFLLKLQPEEGGGDIIVCTPEDAGLSGRLRAHRLLCAIAAGQCGLARRSIPLVVDPEVEELLDAVRQSR